MEWVERTDRTVDAAKDFLLDQLGVDEDEAEFEVLEEPKPGLFGRVRGQARVRARVKPRAPRAKEERRRRPAKSQSGERGNGQRKGGAREAAPAKATDSADTEIETADVEDEATPVARSERGGRGGDRGADRGEDRGGRSESGRGRDQAPATPVDPAPFLEPLTAFLDELAVAFGVTAKAEVDVTEEGELEARLVGDDLGALIGPAGGVINAIQELSRTFLQKVAQGGSAPRLRVDVGGYRADRRTALAAFAQEIARQVVETGNPHAFEPMGSVDRKVVHDAAGEVEGVVTSSDGEDPARRVVIAKA